jgi:DNA-binding GntR family transcriptional regulator
LFKLAGNDSDTQAMRQNAKRQERPAPQPRKQAGSVATSEAAFSPAKLSRQTLNDQIYVRLKEAIMAGGLLPGTVLTIRELAESFGVSMMPVREALSRLIAEKALILQPNRSVAVPVITPERFRQITRVRLLLEGTAAREGAERISRRSIAELERLNETMEKAGPGEPKKFLDINRRFHFTLYWASGEEIMVDMIESLWMQSGPLLNYLLRAAAARDTNLEMHHRELIAALGKGDARGAEEAIRADIQSAADYILPLIVGDRESELG